MARAVTYRPEVRGLAQIGTSREIGQLSMEGGRRIAATAKRDNPTGEYSVTPATVTAGWRHERRAGAMVTEEVPGRGPERRSLARASQEARG